MSRDRAGKHPNCKRNEPEKLEICGLIKYSSLPVEELTKITNGNYFAALKIYASIMTEIDKCCKWDSEIFLFLISN